MPKRGNPVPVTVYFDGTNVKYLIDHEESISKHLNRLVTDERVNGVMVSKIYVHKGMFDEVCEERNKLRDENRKLREMISQMQDEELYRWIEKTYDILENAAEQCELFHNLIKNTKE